MTDHDHEHGDTHGPDRGRDRQHAHDHTRAGTARWRIGIALALTSAMLAAGLLGAALTGSLALLTDAGHVLTDALGLALAFAAATLATRPASDRRTWGFRRAEVLGAATQAAILLVVGLFAVVEGIRRLIQPTAVEADGLLIFGAIGLAGNLIALAVLAGGRGENLNLRAAFTEVLADALGSVAVIAGALVISATGWVQADAVAGLVVAALILPRALAILREAAGVLLEETPAGLDLADVRSHMLELPHVREVHDLHASRIDTGLPILTAHVVVDDGCFHDGHTAELLAGLRACVATHFPVCVEHATFQLEPVSGRCAWDH